jgi:hypothetical protein
MSGSWGAGGFDPDLFLKQMGSLTGSSGGLGAIAGPLTGDPMSGANTWGAADPSSGWFGKNTADTLDALSKGLGGLKPLADPMAAQARQGAPAGSFHPGEQPQLLTQYVNQLRERQQQLRSQFMPKVSGLLGG